MEEQNGEYGRPLSRGTGTRPGQPDTEAQKEIAAAVKEYLPARLFGLPVVTTASGPGNDAENIKRKKGKKQPKSTG